MSYKIIQGNNIDVLKTYPDNHFDSIVTDPPYQINFLGKDWDKSVGSVELYKECLRVLKPGGHMLAFSAARTYHHLAMAAENAGFEIRDQIMWIYSSGFPKSQDIGKSIDRSENKRKNANTGDKWNNQRGKVNTTTCTQCNKNNVIIGIGFNCKETDCEMAERLKPAENEWAGWGTQLKPAHEPIVMARKPLGKGNSIARNCQEHGTGALNIDATRIPFIDAAEQERYKKQRIANANQPDNPRKTALGSFADKLNLTTSSDYIEPVVSGIGRFPSNVLGELGEYQKFFYCPKVGRKERHLGFDLTDIATNPEGKYDRTNTTDNANERIENMNGNNHPTVKPIKLMEYLIKLITPPGGTVLDPFNGSGSTGCAAVGLGFNYVGIDLDATYVDISNKRIDAWTKPNNTFDDLFDDADVE